jgi:hypothetical protein
VVKGTTLPEVGIRVLDRSGNPYQLLPGESYPKPALSGEGFRQLKSKDRGKRSDWYPSHSMLVLPEDYFQVVALPGAQARISIALQEAQPQGQGQPQQPQGPALVSHFFVQRLHLAVKDAAAAATQQVRPYILDNSGFLRKWHDPAEQGGPWRRRDAELLATLRADGCEALQDWVDGRRQEVLLLPDGQLLR